MATITLSIGMARNDTLRLMTVDDERAFRDSVSAALRRADADIHVRAARTIGYWTDEATGTLVREPSLTWVATVEDEWAMVNLRNALAPIAHRYHQDAIALTIGTTIMVKGEADAR